jgi:ribosomal protein L15
MTTLQIGKLAQWIRDNRIDPTREITMKELKRSGAVHSVKEGGIKLLGNVSTCLDDGPAVQAS